MGSPIRSILGMRKLVPASSNSRRCSSTNYCYHSRQMFQIYAVDQPDRIRRFKSSIMAKLYTRNEHSKNMEKARWVA